MGDGTELISDDEVLYRRIQLCHFPNGVLSPQAFHPHEYDKTGISVFRAKYVTPEQVAQNGRGKQYYVAVHKAGELRAKGIDIVPQVSGHQIGHAELPSLRYDNRKENEVKEAEQLLARKLCLKILGPFP